MSLRARLSGARSMSLRARLSAIAVPAALAAGAGLGAVAPRAAAQSTGPLLAAARLQGTYQLAGRLTVAAHVRGERVGQAVSRSWSFFSTCPTGACPTVSLVRQRPAGTDTLTLQQRSAGYYVGYGSFSAPLQCGALTYTTGERVPFTITVRVTDATVQDGTVVATNLNATYGNGYRVNLTPCVAVLGHDAAVYQGQLIGPARDRAARRARR
jgi:hypothetical protein